jgi:CubicO group peptidase (beta-lactamase class C family)
MLRVKAIRNQLAKAAIRHNRSRNPGEDFSKVMIRELLDPSSAVFNFITNTGDYFNVVNDRASHAGELPAAGVIATPRGLAGVYAPLSLGGEHNGVRLVSPEAIDRMRIPRAVTDLDAVLGGPTAYTLGFSKSWPNPLEGSGVIIGEEAFGTSGAGGQLGFADPSYRLAFGYLMNRHGSGTGLNERGQSLVDATYRCLDSPGRTSRYWMRPYSS